VSALTGPAARRPDTSSAAPGRAALGAVAALTGLGALLRGWGLAHQGLWYDEADTALLMHFSAGRMLGLIPQTESTPPLYFCVAWVWSHVVGDTAAGLRSLSAVAGVAVIPVAYAAAAEMICRRAGVICAALTACSPLLVWYSQEARAYELLVLLSGLSLLAAARAARVPEPRRAALWALAAVLSLTTHYYGAMVVAGEAAWLLLGHRRRRAIAVAVLAVLAGGAALLPLAIAQNTTGNGAWIARFSVRLRLAQVVPQFLIGTDAPARAVLKFAAIGLALLGLALLARARPAERRGALIAGGLAVGGLALAVLLAAVGFDDLLTRNLIELWLPAAIAVSGGLAAVRVPRIAAAAVAAGLCAVGLVAVVGVATDHRFQRPDWPGVARALGDAPPPGQTRAILIQRYRTLLPLSLELPGLRVLHGAVRVRQLDVIAMHSPSQPLCWWGAECNLISSATQRRYPIPGLRTVARGEVRQFEITELRGADPIRLTRAAVRRALSATTLSHDVLMVQRGS
jgi:mannosyltransferase